MYPKYFFERFWEGEQKNQIFVGTAFDSTINERFDLINSVVKEVGFEKAFRVGLNSEANSINDNIFDAIANSKMLIFDLSDDDRKGYINHNVIYELGIAQAMREPSDIIIIRKETRRKTDIPFDIQSININFFPEKFTKEWIKTKIESSLENQKWHKSKRVHVAAESLDENCLFLMKQIGIRPRGHNHFNRDKLTDNQKNSVARLVDLGILKFACKVEGEWIEWAYHWTSFGYEVMKHIGLKQLTVEEFKKSPHYSTVMKAHEDFAKRKKAFLRETNKNDKPKN